MLTWQSLTNIIWCFFFFCAVDILDENVIGLSLQEILPDNNNIKAEKMLVANPPNILKRAKSMKMENAVSRQVSIENLRLCII